MSGNPLNLALRFLLEITALISLGIWGYKQFESPLNILLMVLAPLIFAGIWGTFAVRNDPSRSGKTIVSTRGWLRLIIELIMFGFAAVSLSFAGYNVIAIVFGAVVVLHYLLSMDRMIWLIRH